MLILLSLSLSAIPQLALILKNNLKTSDSIELLKQNLARHHSSLDLYNELLKPQKAVNHFRFAMNLLASENPTALGKIRFHLERSIFYDQNFVQAYYNLAILDFKQNTLHQTRQHLQKILNLQPYHFKANLMLCDLLLELDRNLFEAVRCYTKLLDSKNVEKSELKSKLDFSAPIASKTAFQNESKETRKILTLAQHNLCSVLDYLKINNQPTISQLMNNNATMNISTYCSNLVVPSNTLIQQIHFQVPIKLT